MSIKLVVGIDAALTEVLLKSGVTAMAYETITDAKGSLPCLYCMSEIACRMATLKGAKYLEKPTAAAACREDPGMMNGLNTYDGKCTFAAVAEALGLEYTDPETLI